ncbi:tetratricopeptide repeat protein [Bacillaceae bacterium W0354]
MDGTIGNIIKIKRKEMNLTQEELCEGICTTSYLSRIENNKVLANEEIYRLLLKRLGINYENASQISEKVNMQIEKWYMNMLLSRKYINIPEELNNISYLPDGHITLKFDIVYCRYLLLKNDIDKVEKTLQNLSKVVSKQSSRNYFIYINTLMLYYFQTQNYSNAVQSGLNLITIRDLKSLGKDIEIAFFYYNLGLNLKNTYSYKESIKYINKALSIFNRGYLEYTVDCYNLLGICHNNLREWSVAVENYSTALKMIRYLKEDYKQYLGLIYNNFGYCYECQKNYHEAISYYKKSLNNKNENRQIITFINIIRCYYNLKLFQEAKKWLIKALEICNEQTNELYIIQIKIFKLLLLSNIPNIDEVTKIQNTSMKFLFKNQLWDLAIYYSKIFAKLYEGQKHYKQSNKMYKMALNASEKLLKSN